MAPDPTSGLSPERRSALLGLKLKALVGASPEADTSTYPHGAAIVVGEEAWVLVEGGASRSLGGAVAWTRRSGATSTSVVVDSADDAGTLARRSAQLDWPVRIWIAVDRLLVGADPAPLAAAAPADPLHLELIDMIANAGADPLVERGVVTGEVRGLEVCRVVDAPTIGRLIEYADIDIGAEGIGIEVGVGPTDREAFRLIHGNLPTADALAEVVATVERHRRPDAPQHPLNRIARERYLRWQVEQEPSLVGLRVVVPADPPVPRPGLNEAVPCVAAGIDLDGAAVRVVCSTGIDLDLVGFVADVQTTSPEPVVVVMPERDLVPIAAELLGLLTTSVRIETVSP